MHAIKRQTTVKAPPEKVFSYLADFARHAEWSAHRLRVEKSSQGALGVGTTFASVGRMTGGKFNDAITITEFLPNERIVFEVSGDTGRFRHYLSLSEEPGMTRLTKGVEPLELNLEWRLRWLLAQFVIPHILGGDLKRIKRKLEES